MSETIKIKVKNSYFVIAENILFDKYAGEIGPDACFLYLFFKRIGAADKVISVSYKYITKKMGWKNEKIAKLLKSLMSVNLVEKRKTSKANVYIISDLMPENIEYYAKYYAASVEKSSKENAIHSFIEEPPETTGAASSLDKKIDYDDENLPNWIKEPIKNEETPPPKTPENSGHCSKIEPTLFENRTMRCSKIEHKDRYNIDIDILTKVSGKPPEFLQKVINQLADIPYAWRGVAIEFIARIKKTLTEKDLSAINKLNKLHKPAVVYTQLRRLWNRLKYQPNGLDKLNFSYIYATMKNYSTLENKKNKKQEKKYGSITAEKSPEQLQREREIAEREQRKWDEFMRQQAEKNRATIPAVAAVM